MSGFALLPRPGAGGGRAGRRRPEPRGRPLPDLGSCQVFPDPPASLPARAPSQSDMSAWNQNVSKAPVAGDSAAVIAYIDANGGDHLHPDFGSPRTYGIPYSVVGAGQPKLPIHYTAYGDESDPGPFPIPEGAPVEGGNGSDGDRHVLVVDRGNCVLYELYRAFYKRRRAPLERRFRRQVGPALEGRRSDGWTSADAAGLPIFPGLVRRDEVESGRIDHAIRVTFDSTREAWLRPASHCAGDTRTRTRRRWGCACA